VATSIQSVPFPSPPALGFSVSDSTLTEVLIADELTLIREGFAALVNSIAGFRVVAQVEGGQRALAEIARLKPTLALLNLDLTDLAATEVISRVRSSGLPTRCAVLTTRIDAPTVREVLRQGAAGYILKTSSKQQMAEALAYMLLGGIYVSPQIEMTSLLTTRPGVGSVADPADLLSSREFQVFSQLVDGVRCKEIAARLSISPKTVDTYRSSLMRKLDIHHLAGLVKFSVQRDLANNLKDVERVGA
jgi:two-component system, NarL family, response regulator NreC